VTDDGDVYSMGSTPDSLDKLMMELGRTSPMDPRPTGTDAEALLLLADEDPEEAEELTALAAAQKPLARRAGATPGDPQGRLRRPR
jgi:hypothetical protein